MMKIKLSDLLPEAFHSVWRAAIDPNILNVVCKGGRGSGKSSDIAHIMIQLLMRLPLNALCVRKVDNTIELSIFEQLKWAISEQQVSHLFKVNKSPMRITYLPRGNYIVFRGAQEPERIKSLKSSNYPFGMLWIEELQEFKTEEEVTTITNSMLRGELGNGLFYKFFYSYNPPKRKQSWVNKKYETQFQPDNTFVHHSTYKDNPHISKQFIEEAEAAKERNKKRYDWEYGGKAIGSGVVPFDNLVFRTITDAEYKAFDNIRQGQDYGYATDPYSFVRWHYDKKRRIAYAMDELCGLKLSNRYTANWIKDKGYGRTTTVSDSAEPKSIAEQKEYGIRVKGAKKGPDSVEYGEEWLDDLEAIVIDPKRTPNIAREFENIDYKVDRDGNPLPKLDDNDNHTIDATRYAFENDMNNKKAKISSSSAW